MTQLAIKRVEKLVGFGIKTTRKLGILSEGHILSAIRPGQRYIFDYFLSFDTKVWLFMILTLIIISLMMSLTQRSFKLILSNFWHFSSILLSEIFPKRMITNNLTQRIIICFWLIFCTIFLSAFSGVLYGFFIKNIPNDVIDSWDELYSIKELRITISDYSLFSDYSKNNKNSFDFKARIDEKFSLNYSESDYLSLFEEIKKSNRVFMGEKQALNALVSKYGQTLKNSLHLSKYGGGTTPYALILNTFIDSQLEIDLNKL
jgi:uncharacterized membrane protein YcgQ (UPF0703/DUF1980 family)